MASALIGMGGNVGDVRATLAQAVAAFCDGDVVELVARSADYRTPPWGVTDQAPFVNIALKIATSLPPESLLQRALKVEASLGRNRAAERRWGPRTVDIDILAYDDLALDVAGLKLPHPRMLERAFVLLPLADVAPEWKIDGKTVGEWAALVDATGIERL